MPAAAAMSIPRRNVHGRGPIASGAQGDGVCLACRWRNFSSVFLTRASFLVMRSLIEQLDRRLCVALETMEAGG